MDTTFKMPLMRMKRLKAAIMAAHGYTEEAAFRLMFNYRYSKLSKVYHDRARIYIREALRQRHKNRLVIYAISRSGYGEVSWLA